MSVRNTKALCCLNTDREARSNKRQEARASSAPDIFENCPWRRGQQLVLCNNNIFR